MSHQNSTISVDTIEPQSGTTLTMGQSGQNVVINADSIKNNVMKDAGGNALFTSNGSGTLSGVNSAFGSAEVLLATTTISSPVANVDFTSGIDNTYKEYVFEFFDIHPSASSNAHFTFQCNIDGGSGWGSTIQSTVYIARGPESGTASTPGTVASYCQHLGTAFQPIGYDLEDFDSSCFVGELHIFDPSNTTFWTYWYGHSVEQARNGAGYGVDTHYGGVIAHTNAVDEFRFKCNSGNIDAGIIKLWGIK